MLRAAMLTLSLLAPNLAIAQCSGPSFWDQLSATQQTELTQRVADTPYSSGNFWRATRDGTILTIVGTMHLPDPRHDGFLDRALPHLSQADLLLVEATLDDQKDMQIHLAQNPDLMTLTDGMTLPDRLDDATWDAVADAATARGIPAFIAAKMQPWFLSLTLAIPPCAMAAIGSGAGGLDTALMTRANDMNVPTAPLEPWEDMLDLLTSGTVEDQIDALRIGLIAPDIQDAMIVALTDFYFAEQSAMGWYLADFTKDFLPPENAALFDEQMQELTDVLLIQRNANWIPVIEDAAATHDNVFIGFGAAHLFGETGVLRLLEQNGWAITPI